MHPQLIFMNSRNNAKASSFISFLTFINLIKQNWRILENLVRVPFFFPISHLVLDGECHPSLYPGGVETSNGQINDHTEIVSPAPPTGPEDWALVESLVRNLLAGSDQHWRHPGTVKRVESSGASAGSIWILIDSLGLRPEVSQTSSLRVPQPAQDVEAGDEDSPCRNVLLSRPQNLTFEM